MRVQQGDSDARMTYEVMLRLLECYDMATLRPSHHTHSDWDWEEEQYMEWEEKCATHAQSEWLPIIYKVWKNPPTTEDKIKKEIFDSAIESLMLDMHEKFPDDTRHVFGADIEKFITNSETENN